MYCKEDFDSEFKNTRKDFITHAQFIELFVICLKNDSFNVAILIYTIYLNPLEDMDSVLVDVLM